MLRPAVVSTSLLSLIVLGFLGWNTVSAKKLPVWKGKIVATYPHDPNAYTQGLIIHEGQMYEGTGQYGNSNLRKVDLKTGTVQESLALDQQYFGEGITIFDDQIFQITWKNNLCFVYDLKTFKYKKFFRYRHEGWGLTNNGKELILSDGTSDIRFLDPETFKEKRTITAREGKQRVKNLNELEYIDNEIWANLWYDDRIVRISPENGQVLGYIDLSTIYPPRERQDREKVMNGIAQDPETKKIYITGKNWPKLFEIELQK